MVVLLSILVLCGFLAAPVALPFLFWAPILRLRPMRVVVDSSAVPLDPRPRLAPAPSASASERAAIEEDVTRFGEELAAHPFVPGPSTSEEALAWYGKALDAYEAAERSLKHAGDTLDGPSRDLADGRHAILALDAVLLGKPVPAREPCYFARRHGIAETAIMWAPYGGERRLIPVCAQCADRRRERGGRSGVAFGSRAGRELDDPTGRSGPGVRTGTSPGTALAEFHGRWKRTVAMPQIADDEFVILRIEMSILNFYTSKTSVKAVMADEARFDEGRNLLPPSSSSVRCRVVAPTATHSLEVVGFGPWTIDILSIANAHPFAYRVTGSKGADVFRFTGQGGRAAFAYQGDGSFTATIYRIGEPRDYRESVFFGSGKSRRVVDVHSGDLIAVQAGRGTWSIDVVDGEEPAG